ncbi:alpha/beta fold hydrolase [Nakamurella flavida]|uniref:Alpha/beta fold hydrolase n=1 Tax=Nakamurella flavida TaxID=363630 RepID=A0A939C665_9ACTN|nr:alpha/beta fold hydrolase [Nakamurella flavida]MBM9477689.1 alpha/beta fold hydrolase [Nakamurella flavida]MDP9779241.1 pimeloyl-ACP methyl ester carboxylesterase [Nakamurella flavida]
MSERRAVAGGTVVPLSRPFQGYRLAHERAGSGPAVVLLHGWPGDRHDFAAVVPLLADRATVITPDLRGFGESDFHDGADVRAFSVEAQAAGVLDLLDELGVERAVVGGYDIGSRIGQQLAALAPHRVAALVLTPPLPGAGDRLLAAPVQREFWYQVLHRLDLADRLFDGQPAAVAAYLEHIWTHWSGPGHPVPAEDLRRLVELYSRPGAFTASIAWYRSRPHPSTVRPEEPPPSAERPAIPVEALWPEFDPLFPSAWADRLDEW